MNPADFSTGIFNWYTAFMGIMLIAILVFYTSMESKRRKAS
ncbi:MAG TPA: hypothetical protein PKN81_16490 [Anaerolineales bacterium]|nr:hypothetical protein [Anaerolineales bacterium]